MVFICNHCCRQFASWKNLKIHEAKVHTKAAKKSKKINKKRGATSIAKNKLLDNDESVQQQQVDGATCGAIDAEMASDEMLFDSAAFDDAAESTLLTRELPAKSGLAVEYLLPLDQDCRQAKTGQELNPMITQDDKELIFVQIVNENALSAGTANAILNWARLFEGSTQNLPSYEVLNEKISYRMKKEDRASNPLKAQKFKHKVNLPVPPIYNGRREGGVDFIYTDMLAVAASIIDAVVKDEGQFHLNADLYNEHEQRRYNANFNSGNWH